MSKPYTFNELLIITIAREIRDNENTILGIGLPMVAGAMAKARHAPNAVLMMESGIIDFHPTVPTKHIADTSAFPGFSCSVDLFTAFSMTYRGFVDLSVLGVAQVDRYGNVNTTVAGPYENPTIRFPGAGGATDFLSYSKRTILTMRGGEFVEKLSYITSPGFLEGGDSREASGHFPANSGPEMVISTDGIFRFDVDSKEIYLSEIHKGADVEQIKSKVPWDLKVSDNLIKIPPPTDEEIDFIRRFAPGESAGKYLLYELAFKHFTESTYS